MLRFILRYVKASRFGIVLLIGFVIGTVAVAAVVAAGDDKTRDNGANDGTAEQAVPEESATPPSVLGTTNAEVVIGGGPPRFATPDASQIPIAPEVPLPDEATGMPLGPAIDLVSKVAGVSAVIEAIEARDAERLVALFSTRSADCARPEFPIAGVGRGSTLERCIETNQASPDGKFEAVNFGGSYQSIEWMQGLFTAALGAEPVELILVTRTVGQVPTYYVAFSTGSFSIAGLLPLAGEDVPGRAIVMEVRVRAVEPIEQVSFLAEEDFALAWIQLIQPDGQELVFPTNLDGFERARPH